MKRLHLSISHTKLVYFTWKTMVWFTSKFCCNWCEKFMQIQILLFYMKIHFKSIFEIWQAVLTHVDCCGWIKNGINSAGCKCISCNMSFWTNVRYYMSLLSWLELYLCLFIRKAEFGSVLESLLENTLLNVMQEAFHQEFNITTRPRLVALPPRPHSAAATSKH